MSIQIRVWGTYREYDTYMYMYLAMSRHIGNTARKLI